MNNQYQIGRGKENTECFSTWFLAFITQSEKTFNSLEWSKSQLTDGDIMKINISAGNETMPFYRLNRSMRNQIMSCVH